MKTQKLDKQAAFGKTIRRLREASGRSQEELAAAAGLHRTYVSLLERGLRNPSLDVIDTIALALGISITQLVAEFEVASDGDTN
jgi:transcriptional regulator with XRE-family HTH domain